MPANRRSSGATELLLISVKVPELYYIFKFNLLIFIKNKLVFLIDHFYLLKCRCELNYVALHCFYTFLDLANLPLQSAGILHQYQPVNKTNYPTY